ncbi:Protein 21.1 [Giardia lamblia P15]|uniref:Protein 21.1 n=1 Tax=Giardia intestinalis (strain P15) TaxID=658858 RepID=E1F4F8_GIAIA|nr:Protein 21.1 [Giardia lamblia P15]
MQIHEEPNCLEEWFSAAITGNEEYINKHKSDCVGSVNQAGKTALMLAGEMGALGTLALLAPLEAKRLSPEGRCALEYAILEEQLKSIPILLQYEARFMQETGKDPLLLALQNYAKSSALEIIAFSEETDALDYSQALELANNMAYHDIVEALQCKLGTDDTNKADLNRPTISGVTKIGDAPGTYITADGRNLSLSMSVSFGDRSRSCSLAPHRPRQIDYDFLLYAKDQEILRLQALLVHLSSNMKLKVTNLITHTHDHTALEDVDKLQSNLASAMLTIDELTERLQQQKTIISVSVPSVQAPSDKSNAIDNSNKDADEVKTLKKTVYLLTETINELEDKLRLSASATDLAERKVTERIFTENINLKKTIEILSGKLDCLSKSVPHSATNDVQWSQASNGDSSLNPPSIGAVLTDSMLTKLSVGLPRSMSSGATAVSPGQKLANMALSQESVSANISSGHSGHNWAYHSDKMISHIDVSTPTQSRRSTITRPRAPARRNTQWYAEQVKRVGRVQC